MFLLVVMTKITRVLPIRSVIIRTENNVANPMYSEDKLSTAEFPVSITKCSLQVSY